MPATTRGAAVPSNLDEHCHAPSSGAAATDYDEVVRALEPGPRPVANPIAPLLQRPEPAMERALDHADPRGAQTTTAKRDPHRRASRDLAGGAYRNTGPCEREQGSGRSVARAEGIMGQRKHRDGHARGDDRRPWRGRRDAHSDRLTRDHLARSTSATARAGAGLCAPPPTSTGDWLTLVPRYGRFVTAPPRLPTGWMTCRLSALRRCRAFFRARWVR
jgi:hypothetical protein